MKKAGLVCVVLCLQGLFADSIDNALLESLRESKEKAEIEKHNKQKYNQADSNLLESSSKHNGNSKPHIVKSHSRSPFRYHLIQNENTQDLEPYKKLTWFFGMGFEYQLPKTNNDGKALLSTGLQLGLFTRFSRHQGFRFSFISNYNLTLKDEFYSIGGAIDYFYDVLLEGRLLSGFGVFFGAAALMPLSIYDTPNVAARIGLAVSGIGTRVEVYGGYPIYQDLRLNNTIVVGVNLHYLF